MTNSYKMPEPYGFYAPTCDVISSEGNEESVAA